MVTEIAVTVMSVSLPTIYTLLKRGYDDGLLSLFEFTRSTRINSRSSSSSRRGHVVQLTNKSTSKLFSSGIKGDYRVDAIGGSSLTSLTTHHVGDLGYDKIHVRHDFDFDVNGTVTVHQMDSMTP